MSDNFDAVEDGQFVWLGVAGFSDHFDDQVVLDLNGCEVLYYRFVCAAGGGDDVEIFGNGFALDFYVENPLSGLWVFGVGEAQLDEVKSGRFVFADQGEGGFGKTGASGSEQPGIVGVGYGAMFSGIAEIVDSGFGFDAGLDVEAHSTAESAFGKQPVFFGTGEAGPECAIFIASVAGSAQIDREMFDGSFDSAGGEDSPGFVLLTGFHDQGALQ